MHSIPRLKNSEICGCTWFNEMKVRGTINTSAQHLVHVGFCGFMDCFSARFESTMPFAPIEVLDEHLPAPFYL